MRGWCPLCEFCTTVALELKTAITTLVQKSAEPRVARKAPGTLTRMPDDLDEEQPKAAPTAPAERARDGVFTGFGIASAVLGVISVAAVVLGALIWNGHRHEIHERDYQDTVLQAAADWTGVLINMNSGTVTESMQKLHDGTVGQLNANFEAAVEPFSQVVQKLQSQTVGQVESVAIESLFHASPGDRGLPTVPQPELSTVASRTDNVIVVATSISQNTGAKPLTVHWALRLGVSDVDGKLLISRLETIR